MGETNWIMRVSHSPESGIVDPSLLVKNPRMLVTLTPRPLKKWKDPCVGPPADFSPFKATITTPRYTLVVSVGVMWRDAASSRWDVGMSVQVNKKSILGRRRSNVTAPRRVCLIGGEVVSWAAPDGDAWGLGEVWVIYESLLGQEMLWE